MSTSHAQEQMEARVYAALNAIVRADMAPFLALFHEDGVMEYPFRPPGPPERIAGKPALAAALGHYPDHLRLHRILPHATHHAPDVMVLEFAADGTAVATNRNFHQTYVAVIAHSDGKVSSWRDYWDPLVAAQAMGGLDRIADVTTEEAAS